MKETRTRGCFSPFRSAGAGGIFLSVLVSWVKGEEEQEAAETARGALARGSGEALCSASFRFAGICYTISPFGTSLLSCQNSEGWPQRNRKKLILELKMDEL